MSRSVVVLDYGSGNLRSAERALATASCGLTLAYCRLFPLAAEVLGQALDVAAGPVTHEVAGHANRALEHHLERRLTTVAMFETG